MNKVLVKVSFPRIGKLYDVWLPLNKTIYNIISLLLKGVNELNDNIYPTDEIPILYNKKTGLNYDLNSILKDTNIRNGTELILM